MTTARQFHLSIEAGAALRQILGIMVDQTMADHGWDWDLEHVVGLDQYLEGRWTPEEWSAVRGDDRPVELELADAALLLDGMAYTEVASAELPWVDMVRWTSDFVTAELRQHWTEDEWRALPTRRFPTLGW